MVSFADIIRYPKNVKNTDLHIILFVKTRIQTVMYAARILCYYNQKVLDVIPGPLMESYF